MSCQRNEMISDREARLELGKLVKKYVSDLSEQDRLISVIEDKNRPGLPVRGVLESIRKFKIQEYSDQEKELIDDLIYMFG